MKRLIRWLCPSRWLVESTTTEAKAHLKEVEDKDPEVQALAEELRAARRRNNFSGMVDAAIRARPRSNP